MIVELPREVREVMVSNPEQIDAVLQTSTRAYLIGKAAGEANIFFVDKEGTADGDPRGHHRARSYRLGESPQPRSSRAHITVETADGSVVLTGTVKIPSMPPAPARSRRSYRRRPNARGNSTTSEL